MTVNAVELHLQSGSPKLSVVRQHSKTSSSQIEMSHSAIPNDQRSDVLGIVCSAGCAAHCAAMPVVASAAPMVGMGWLAGSLVHQIVAALCCFFVVKAIIPGWRRHQDRMIAFCVGLGLSLLLLSAFIFPDPCCEPTSILGGWIGIPVLSVGQLELWIGQVSTRYVLLIQPYMTPIGGVLLIAAHLMNLDWMRRYSRPACEARGCLQSSGC